MARWFIPKKNKRGDRGIVSRLLGGVGEVLLFASLGLVGVAWLASLLTLQVSLSTSDQSYYGIVGLCLRIIAAIALIAVGVFRSAVAVWHASCSIERRSAMVERVRSKEARHSAEADSFPTIPLDDDLTDSPGTVLRYRLPCQGSPTGRLVGVSLICLVLLGIASITSVLAGETIRAREPDVLLIIVSAAAVAGAGWAIYRLLATLLRLAAIGPTSLEVSEHPLFPGQDLKISLTQTGRTTFRRIEISLLCWEQVIYQQGTDVRTEQRIVYRQTVFDEKNVEVDPLKPFEKLINVTVPGRIMHSFRSRNNSVEWALVVEGRAVRFSRFTHTFPVVIFPEPADSPVPDSTSAAATVSPSC